MTSVDFVKLRSNGQIKCCKKLKNAKEYSSPSKKIENHVSFVKLAAFSQNSFRNQTVICKFYKFILKRR